MFARGRRDGLAFLVFKARSVVDVEEVVSRIAFRKRGSKFGR